MITPTQMRMARAALRLSMREAAKKLGVSHNAIARYEREDEAAMSVATVNRIGKWFISQRVYFGPKDLVCVGSDAFYQERWMSIACWQLMKEANLAPSSTDLIGAYKRSNSRSSQ